MHRIFNILSAISLILLVVFCQGEYSSFELLVLDSILFALWAIYWKMDTL